MIRKMLIAAAFITGSVINGKAQGFMDQEAVAPLLESSIAGLPPSAVGWHEYPFTASDRNTKSLLARLKVHLDALPGGMEGHRMQIIELSNRVLGKYMMQRRSLLIPDSFPDDFRAYTPYPLAYTGADSIAKLFVIDKYTQTFGAYEYGQLVRWGLISSGREDDLTPNGRYIFNWKQEYRESSEAPEGEVWKLRWVYNFHGPRGIHVHQYQLPVATPASHGCVRLSEADAAWNFGWAKPGTMVLVINHNPVGLSAHWLDANTSLVSLPEEPAGVPSGVQDQKVAGW